MNNDEFLRRLSELAEWHRPQTGPGGQASISKGRARAVPVHPGPITQEELDLMTDEAAQDYYDRLMTWREAQPNASVPPEIIKLKTYARKCEDCNKSCDSNRRVECKLYLTGREHWREYCTACELFRDPRTKEFSIKREASGQVFGNLYRRDKPMPKIREPKPPKVPKPLGRPKKITKSQLMEQFIAEGTWEVTETADTITRVFVPKK